LLDSIRALPKEGFYNLLTEKYIENAERFELLTMNSLLKLGLSRLPTIKELGLTPDELFDRAMKLYIQCEDANERIKHPLCTKELYCWAAVFDKSYLTFFDSNEDEEFILSSTGMISDNEPSFLTIGGLDLSKRGYLFEKLTDKKEQEAMRLKCADDLAFTFLMYENFNIFNLSSTRCMVLVHPFFKLYNKEIGVINEMKIEGNPPDMWPSFFETREIVQAPNCKYKFYGVHTKDDVFEYKAVKISKYDTIYVNWLILTHTDKLIGFKSIDKIFDSLACATLMEALNNKEIYRGDIISRASSFIESMEKSKYNYILSEYPKFDFKCSVDADDWATWFRKSAEREMRHNPYLLRELLRKEDDFRTMPQFDFMGTPNERVARAKKDLAMLEKRTKK